MAGLESGGARAYASPNTIAMLQSG